MGNGTKCMLIIELIVTGCMIHCTRGTKRPGSPNDCASDDAIVGALTNSAEVDEQEYKWWIYINEQLPPQSFPLQRALIWAAQRNDITVVRSLLAAMCNDGRESRTNDWALRMALINGSVAVVTYLLEVIPYEDMPWGPWPLHLAENGHSDVVRPVLARRFPSHSKIWYNLLRGAVRCSNMALADILFDDIPVPLNMYDIELPFVVACRHDDRRVVTTLLDNGVAVDAYHAVALRSASQYGQVDLVRLLLSRGANVNYINPVANDGRTVLVHAAYHRQRAVVHTLLDAKADVAVATEAEPNMEALSPRKQQRLQQRLTELRLLQRLRLLPLLRSVVEHVIWPYLIED